MTETDAKSVEHTRLVRLLRRSVSGPVAADVQVRGIWDQFVTRFVATNAPRGDVGRFTDEDIAEGVGWQGEASELVDSLIKAGRLVTHPEHRLVVADWHRIAPAYLRSNVKHAGGFLTSDVVPDRNDSRNEDRNDGPNEGTIAHCYEPVTPTVYSSLTYSSLPSSPTSWGKAEQEEVEGELLKCGVRYPETAAAKAIEHRCTSTDVKAVIAYWRCMKPAWDAGGLYDRIALLRPGQDHTTLWPPPSAAYERSMAAPSSSKAVNECTGDNASRREKLALVAERFAEVHRTHWPTIERMDETSLRELFDVAFGGDAETEWKSRERRGGAIWKPQQVALVEALEKQGLPA